MHVMQTCTCASRLCTAHQKYAMRARACTDTGSHVGGITLNEACHLMDPSGGEFQSCKPQTEIAKALVAGTAESPTPVTPLRMRCPRRWTPRFFISGLEAADLKYWRRPTSMIWQTAILYRQPIIPWRGHGIPGIHGIHANNWSARECECKNSVLTCDLFLCHHGLLRLFSGKRTGKKGRSNSTKNFKAMKRCLSLFSVSLFSENLPTILLFHRKICIFFPRLFQPPRENVLTCMNIFLCMRGV